ncbi:MAG: hypothetical protein A2W93_11530 [Bacteroidetes bacterium GWF2_43_63]|nr:MAG: hypothetical protein A2W94_14405 [Bacteroidetes bacterium GWE2_42_42]OFY54901.1 MAG: hypothetical protein A2W93_11530 [Bacteroidetes bacterium GWF2_43_63]HCB63191.1 hypothetical protein [Bacteroidales bacterium]HCY22204.1 hypothetical protein [Bacteroidales bacterium]
MCSQSNKLLLPSLLAPPAKLMALMCHAEEIIIDTHETYPKQTLRNRYFIGGPNDIRSLVVPVHKPNGHRTKTSEIEIDYNENWPLYHRKTLTTAYSKSPFFLYYADYIFAEFERDHKRLIDLNAALQNIFMKWMNIKTSVSFADDFVREFNGVDCRTSCKNSAEWVLQQSYYQPFDTIYGFRNSLSVLDILFNLGPEAGDHLIKETDYAGLQSS